MCFGLESDSKVMSGLEVIKLEYSVRLKIKAMIGCLLRFIFRVRKQPIIALYFESENEFKFYNLEAWDPNHLLLYTHSYLTITRSYT